MKSKEETTRKTRGHIRWICDRIGPRPPCSDAEARCAEYIRNEWSKHTDQTRLEAFTCHPGAYRATFRWPIALFFLALCLYPFAPFLSFTCSAGSTLILLFNLILNPAAAADESKTIRIGTPGTHRRTFVAGIRGVTTASSDAIPVVVDSAGQLGTISSSARVKHDIRDVGEGASVAQFEACTGLAYATIAGCRRACGCRQTRPSFTGWEKPSTAT